MKNVTRSLSQTVNQKMHKKDYICVTENQADEIIKDWLDDEATNNIFVSEYVEGDENLTLDDVMYKSDCIN